jgi:3-hydroxyisobutyrate dehydrogenase-like beta-hydroxyacid dehydrogenase
VFGRPDAAAEQRLTICVAGEATAKKTVFPYLQFMGQKVFDFGDTPEKVNCVKIAGNFLILANVEILAEAFAFIQKSGVDPQAFYTMLSESLLPSPVVKGYGKRLLERNFKEGGFRMELGAKDINLLLQHANLAKTPMPVASLLHNRLLTSLAKMRGNLDWSAIFVSVFEDAGV